MKLRHFAVLAMALAAMAETAPVRSSSQTDKPDPKELAAVQRIRSRIEERALKAAKTPAAAYDVTIPNTTVDRKSTRLHSSHLVISYAVFCLKIKIRLIQDKLK